METHARGKTETGEILRRKPYSVITTQREYIHDTFCLHLVNPLSRPYLQQTPELLSQVRGNFGVSVLALTSLDF